MDKKKAEIFRTLIYYKYQTIADACTRGIAGVPEPQRKYWFDNFDDFASKLQLKY